MFLFLIAWTLHDESKHVATIKASSAEHARLLVLAALVGGPKMYKDFLTDNCDDPTVFNVHRVQWPDLSIHSFQA